MIKVILFALGFLLSLSYATTTIKSIPGKTEQNPKDSSELAIDTCKSKICLDNLIDTSINSGGYVHKISGVSKISHRGVGKDQSWGFDGRIIDDNNPTEFSFTWVTNKNFYDPAHVSFLVSPGFEGFYSFKYNKLGLCFNYTGAYDFYWGSEPSGPIISRLQNPKLFFDWNHKFKDANVFKGVDLNLSLWAHESNGMFIERKGEYDTIEHGFPTEGNDHYNAQDWASMGWDYYYIEAKIPIKIPACLGNFNITFDGLLKQYYRQDSGLWGVWGYSVKRIEDTALFYNGANGAGSKRIWQYDGSILNIKVQRPFQQHKNYSQYLELDDKIQTGGVQIGSAINPFSNVSNDLVFAFKVFALPTVFLSWDNGYTLPISNYTLRINEFSIGFELTQ